MLLLSPSIYLRRSKCWGTLLKCRFKLHIELRITNYYFYSFKTSGNTISLQGNSIGRIFLIKTNALKGWLNTKISGIFGSVWYRLKHLHNRHLNNSCSYFPNLYETNGMQCLFILMVKICTLVNAYSFMTQNRPLLVVKWSACSLSIPTIRVRAEDDNFYWVKIAWKEKNRQEKVQTKKSFWNIQRCNSFDLIIQVCIFALNEQK